MMNLLSADRMRLRRSWLLWLMLVLAALISLQVFQEQRPVTAAEIAGGAAWPMDEAYFQFSMVNGIMLSAFVPLFLGADFSDGTVRNKLIAGHRRSSIYLSHLLTAFLASGILTLVTLLVSTAVGLLEGGRIAMPESQFVFFLCSALCCTLAFASLYVLLAMRIPNRAFSAVACIGAFVLLTLLASRLISLLHFPPEARDLLAVTDGKPVFSDPYPNPAYVGGWKRTACEFASDFLPTGQGIQMSNLEADRIHRFPLLSALFILLTSGIGLLAFHRQDLK